MDKLIMEVQVTFDPEIQIPAMEGPLGKVVMIPFGGHVESELFTGDILPGACDVQITNAGGIRHMCAQYMFAGKDMTGADCHVFVQNNGYFEPGSNPMPFRTCPIIMTDSEALLPYFSQARFRTEGWPGEKGVTIKFFDILGDD